MNVMMGFVFFGRELWLPQWWLWLWPVEWWLWLVPKVFAMDFIYLF